MKEYEFNSNLQIESLDYAFLDHLNNPNLGLLKWFGLFKWSGSFQLLVWKYPQRYLFLIFLGISATIFEMNITLKSIKNFWKWPKTLGSY